MHNERSQPSVSHQPRKPILSLILCARNDQYMGNSLWRLQTTLNYVAQNVHELRREDDVEIILTDWGSEIPLHTVLQLSPAAAKMVSFVIVPPVLAQEIQGDSPFSGVHALNAAARRVNGQYIGRIDADTLVGKRFLQLFFELLDGSRLLDTPLESTLMWVGHRGIPYRFAVRSPSLWQVQQFVRWFGHLLPIDFPGPENCFFDAPVGIWLLPRSCWEDCGGYDERFIYWGYMEIEIILRLTKRYSLVHLEDYMDNDFYHLEHYHPLKTRATSRRMNPKEYDSVFHPNSENWGLIQYHIEALPYPLQGNLSEMVRRKQPILEWPLFIFLLLMIGCQIVLDSLILSPRRARSHLTSSYRVWKHRAKVAWETVHG